MPVNWSWKRKIGTMYCKDENSNSKYKLNIYQANCLGAIIYEYKDEETKQDMYRFNHFWNCENHLKRCLGLCKDEDDIYEDWLIKIKLNTFFKDSIKIAKLFARKGYKVELYYKEVKESD